ncbi:murein biosynthesis integral membrane protein MurJ [Nocardiopsis sediminis]|uniref:Murein biosynthesis integral membrane protein MurJ n=1 Tax=Nocardiopsis sediminis TaxID=1778267 RepID=A0ABV8FJC6_9ACTN
MPRNRPPHPAAARTSPHPGPRSPPVTAQNLRPTTDGPPEPDAPPADGPSGADRPGTGRTSAARSSLTMAVGTMASRVTGFVRTVVLAAAIGTQLLGDAYTAANTIPFIVYDLLIGGLMASVIVPFLVRRRRSDPDGGAATEQRLFTLACALLVALTVAGVLAAEALISMYAGAFTGAQREVAVLLARYLLVQIFFVGISGLSSAMLNTRGRFGPPVWAPVLNNLAIIGVGAAFLLTDGPGATPETISPAQVALLGAGTVCGVALQAAVLQWSLRSTGFRWRPRLDLRGSGLGEAARAAGWTFVLVCTMQAGFLVTANLATRAGVRAAAEEVPVGAGLTAYNYAYQLFQLPYAIIAVSIITVLLPRMSEHAADGDWPRLRDAFSRGLRTATALLLPAGAAMAVFAPQICVLLFARGATSTADAAAIGQVLAVFAAGLIPFTGYQLLLRAFYACGDTRTPALLAIGNMAAHTAMALLAYAVLPPGRAVAGIAGGFMLSYLVGLVIGAQVLRRRLGGLHLRSTAVSLLRLHLAAAPAAAAGWITGRALGGVLGTGPAGLALTCLTGAAAIAGVYALACLLLRAPEVRDAAARLRRPLRRRG